MCLCVFLGVVNLHVSWIGGRNGVGLHGRRLGWIECRLSSGYFGGWRDDTFGQHFCHPLRLYSLLALLTLRSCCYWLLVRDKSFLEIGCVSFAILMDGRSFIVTCTSCTVRGLDFIRSDKLPVQEVICGLWLRDIFAGKRTIRVTRPREETKEQLESS